MKSFEKDISDICAVELSALASGGKYSVYGGHTAVVEGHGGLISYDRDKITFKLNKDSLAVEGEGLVILRLDKNFAVVRGKINSVTVKYV